MPRALPSGELSSAARLRGFVPEATLSVTASPCHLSRKGEALARAKSLQLNGGFFLPLTNKDETCPLCQGLALRKTSPGRGKMSPVGDQKGNELSSAARLRGFFPEAPSPSRLCRATSPERERLWQGQKVYSLTAGSFWPVTGEDETCPLCQGLSLRESCRAQRD